ncbi:MAG: hypothetical protein WDN24_00040 [Sphingomonas sp.]
MSGVAYRAAAAAIGLARLLMPRHLKHWAEAMAREAREAPSGREAAEFAFGCLRGAIGEAVEHHLLRPVMRPVGAFAGGMSEEETQMGRGSILERPRLVAALCAFGAIGLGIAYMAAAGAPLRYLLLNAGALAVGLAAALLVVLLADRFARGGGPAAFALSLVLLGTALFGTSVDGTARWLLVAGLPLQPSLVLLPAMLLAYAGSRGRFGTAAMLVAALALALQPDRAMAGAQAAGLAALALLRPERRVLGALAAALLGFAVTLARPDVQPAMPHVDGILYSSFGVHPLAGLAVLGGALLMLLPAAAGFRRGAAGRETHLVFGAAWLAILAAAALGNYPTPLVGYGGSAILGYAIAIALLPGRSGAARPEASAGTLADLPPPAPPPGERLVSAA